MTAQGAKPTSRSLRTPPARFGSMQPAARRSFLSKSFHHSRWRTLCLTSPTCFAPSIRRAWWFRKAYRRFASRQERISTRGRQAPPCNTTSQHALPRRLNPQIQSRRRPTSTRSPASRVARFRRELFGSHDSGRARRQSRRASATRPFARCCLPGICRRTAFVVTRE